MAEVLGHKGYYVTRSGEFYSCRPLCGRGYLLPISKARKMKIFVAPNGYQTIVLDRLTCSVHTLMLRTFKGERPSKKHTAAHKDGIRTTNRISNLYWATWKQQWADKDRHGTYQRGEKNGFSKLTDGLVRKIRSEYRPGVVGKHVSKSGYAFLARKYGLSVYAITSAIKRTSWKHVA